MNCACAFINWNFGEDCQMLLLDEMMVCKDSYISTELTTIEKDWFKCQDFNTARIIEPCISTSECPQETTYFKEFLWLQFMH